ncbi:MAG: CCA tRNA nucleotidyltransferase [Candidatus Omnitrophica bacterium]|nr:CCA tRNA nucleotidyltransferase [Candidatus Omnitrophota bacterium]
MKESSLLNAATEVVRTLRKSGFQALFAGGCVRDFLMKKEPKDYDVATSASPGDVERLFKHTVAIGKKFGVMLVIVKDHQFEVATFRSEGSYSDGRHPDWVKFTTPEEDARRRDFTINGIFFDPIDKKVYDYVGGEKDIDAKTVRAIGSPEKRFAEDHLRMLRTVRFATNLGFTIEDHTWAVLQKMAPAIQTISMERIRDELIKIFTRKNAGLGLRMLSDSGLLKIVLPEAERMKGVQQPPDFHPEGDVFHHTELMLDSLKKPSVELAMSVLFHDIAKPDTYDDSGDRIRFNNHAELGATKTEEIMRRLRFPSKVIEEVAQAVHNHMRFKDIKQMRIGRLRNYLNTETFPLELELHRIDCSASHGMLDNYHYCVEQLKEFKKEIRKPKPIVNGNDLIKSGFEPGPAFKSMLEKLFEHQLEGKFKKKEQGIALAKKLFGRKKSSAQRKIQGL